MLTKTLRQLERDGLVIRRSHADSEFRMLGLTRHLLWIPATAIVGFAVPFVFADLLVLPVDLYYVVYFAATAAFASYVVTTAYHLGYRDFRSSKILQPNIGSTIGSVATLGRSKPHRLSNRPCLLARHGRHPLTSDGSVFATT